MKTEAGNNVPNTNVKVVAKKNKAKVNNNTMKNPKVNYNKSQSILNTPENTPNNPVQGGKKTYNRRKSVKK